MQQAPYAARGSLYAPRLQQVQHAPYAAAGSQQVAIPHEAPYAARSQPRSMLPMLRLPTVAIPHCMQTALQVTSNGNAAA
jgi:hypothetical protein